MIKNGLFLFLKKRKRNWIVNIYIIISSLALSQIFSLYLFHCDDAKEVCRVGADVKGVPSIPIDDAVLHLSIDPSVPVLRPDASHHRPHRGRLRNAHLVKP